MRTIGEIIRSERLKKKISLRVLAEMTKIRKEFISSLESEEWNELPEYPVVSGFVRNIAKNLSIKESMAIAVLRRDYPPKDLPINPKPDIGRGFSWSPKFTFFIGAAAILISVSGYLVIQYLNFISPPDLDVETPTEGESVTVGEIRVSGKTDKDATLSVNNQPVLVDEDGSFSVELKVDDETTQLRVVSKSRSGKETVVMRNINTEIRR